MSQTSIALTERTKCLRADTICRKDLKIGYIEGFFTALDTGKCEIDEKLIEKLAGTVEERNQQQTTESPSTQSSKDISDSEELKFLGKWKSQKSENAKAYYQSLGVGNGSRNLE